MCKHAGKQTDSNKHTKGSACFKVSLLRPCYVPTIYQCLYISLKCDYRVQ